MNEKTRRLWRRAALAGIVLLAGTLRFSGLSWGLRHPVHSDESDLVGPVIAMVEAGDLDHRMYSYPGLFFYLLSPGVYLLGPQKWHGPDAYLVSRGFAAALGVVNVILLYVLGARTLGTGGALAAALLLAVSPLDIQTSHQVRAEGALQTAGLIGILGLRNVGASLRGDVVMGLSLGLAAAVKYTGLLMVPGYLLARMLAPGRRIAGILVAGLLTVTVVILCSPFSLLHWRRTLGRDAVERYTALGSGVATYMKGRGDVASGAAYFLEGAGRTLGPLGVGLFLVGLAIALRESWRPWLPPLVHPAAIVGAMAPGAIHFERHILPGMGIIYLMAALPVELLSRRSRLAALALTLAAAGLPFHSSVQYVYRISWPSAQDKALDWINCNVPRGARILETRREATPGATAGAMIGVDPATYEFFTYTSNDRVGLRLMVPQMDLVITGPGAGGSWGSLLEPVYRGTGPMGALVLQLKIPKVRPCYEALDLKRTHLAASENAPALEAIRDGDLRTAWRTLHPLAGGEWLEIGFDEAVLVGRVEVFLGNRPSRHGPEMRLEVSEDGWDFHSAHAVDARPPIEELVNTNRPLSELLIIDPVRVRALRILQAGLRAEPWVVSEVRVDEVKGTETCALRSPWIHAGVAHNLPR